MSGFCASGGYPSGPVPNVRLRGAGEAQRASLEGVWGPERAWTARSWAKCLELLGKFRGKFPTRAWDGGSMPWPAVALGVHRPNP